MTSNHEYGSTSSTRPSRWPGSFQRPEGHEPRWPGEAHLRFVEMRQEKNDRVSLWLFSSYPYMVDDFVLDDEMYFFQVMEAPYVTVKILAPQSGTSLDSLFVPPDKVRIIPNEGNTNINLALQSVIRHFDQDQATGGGRIDMHRAILIITDAGVDEMPENEFAQLSARNVVPYVIYINVGDTDRRLRQHPDQAASARHDPGVWRRVLRCHGRGQPPARLRGHR